MAEQNNKFDARYKFLDFEYKTEKRLANSHISELQVLQPDRMQNEGARIEIAFVKWKNQDRALVGTTPSKAHRRPLLDIGLPQGSPQ